MLENDSHNSSEHVFCMEKETERVAREESPMERYASLLLCEADRHQRLRQALHKRLRHVQFFPNSVSAGFLGLPVSPSKNGFSVNTADDADAASAILKQKGTHNDADIVPQLTSELISHITTDWSSVEASQEKVIKHICELPTSTDDEFQLIQLIQSDKIRRMEDMYLLLEICFKRMIMSSYSRAGEESAEGPVAFPVGAHNDVVKGELLSNEKRVIENTNFFLPAVPELLDLCDTMDLCLSQCQETRQKIQHQKNVVCGAFGVLAMKRRRVHLTTVIRMLRFIEQRHKQTRDINIFLKAGRFAEVVLSLHQLRIQYEMRKPVLESEEETLEMMCEATTLGETVLKKHLYLCTQGVKALGLALHNRLFQVLDSLQDTCLVWSKDLVCSALRLAYGAHALCCWKGKTTKALNQHSSNNAGNLTAGRLMEAYVMDKLHEVVNENIKNSEISGGGIAVLAESVTLSEVRRCTSQLLTKVSSFLRAVLLLQRCFEALFASESPDNCMKDDCLTFEQAIERFLGDDFAFCKALSSEDEAAVKNYIYDVNSLKKVYEDCCGIGRHAVKEALRLVLSYQTHLPLENLTLLELLLSYRLLFYFVDICRPVFPTDDDFAGNITAEMEARLAMLVKRNYLTAQADTLGQLLRNDTGMFVGATEDDLPPLYPLLPCELELEGNAAHKYLLVPPVRFCYCSKGKVLISHIKCSEEEDMVMLNPFLNTQAFLSPEAIPAADTFRIRLFSSRDALEVFTFSSLMGVKMMVENTMYAQMFRRVALALVYVNLGITSLYVWYILSYFVSSGDQWFFRSTAVDGELKQFARILRDEYLPRSFDWNRVDSSPSLVWRSVVNSRQHLFAAVERATGLCSVLSIGTAFKAILSALKPLLPVDELGQLDSVKELMGRLCTCISQNGLRLLSNQLLSSNAFAISMEEFHWDGSAESFPIAVSKVKGSCSFSYPVRQVMEAFLRCQHELRELYRDAPSVSLRRLLDHMILNVFTGFVEGVSRIRKFNSFGEQQLLHDAEYICHEMFCAQPTLNRRPIIFYVQRYALAMTLSSGLAELVTTMHHLYTTRQLIALTARLDLSKRRDVEHLIQRTHVRDEIPYCLIEEIA
ncbi:hypothetical protein TcYC6_0075170 [Trypanosoma cruzi]|nr:hypothetical protein TcYC6_0075170 [Trypanosoma cruzi]